MTAPTTTGAGINGIRQAWRTFGTVAAERLDSSADAQGHVAALAESAATTLQDAQNAAAAAGGIVTALADSGGAATAEDIADAEAQQAHEAAVVVKAEELVAAVEAVGVAVAELAASAEAGEVHCTQALAGLNQRHQPRETFYNN